MCSAPDIEAPAPPPAPPPVLEQLAPKASSGNDTQARKRTGLSRYKIDNNSGAIARTNKLGGIPKKTGV